MSNREKWNRQRFLQAELVAVVCLLSIWGYRSGRIRSDRVKAALLGQVVKVSSRDPNAFRYLGNYHLDARNFREAASAYEQLLDIEPYSIEAHIGLSSCYRSMGRLEETIEILKKLTQIHPDYAYGFAGLGSALMDVERPVEAVAAYKQAIQLEPSLANLHIQLGTAYVATNDLTGAIQSFQCAIQANAELPRAYYELGKACHKDGQSEQAASAYAKLVELDEGLAIELRGIMGTKS
jgi:tetratricopeptide (TPR) repeat protein